MKKSVLIGLLLGVVSLGGAGVSQAQQAAGATEKEIAALENQWLQAQRTNNPDLEAPLLADRYVYTGSDGKVQHRAQALAEAKSRKYSSVEYENVEVSVFGDAAVAIGGYRGKGTYASGKAFDEHERWTDTWVKMPGGKWQCVATHSSAIGM